MTARRELLGVREYARHRAALGAPTSHVAVLKAIADGRLRGAVVIRGRRKLIDPAKADAAWAANTDPSQQRPRSANAPAPPRSRSRNTQPPGAAASSRHAKRPPKSFNELRVEKMKWETRREELEYRRESEKLVPVDQVKRQVFERFHSLQTKSYQMVERIKRRLALAGDVRKVGELLLRELRAIYEAEADRALRASEQAERDDELPAVTAPTSPAPTAEAGDE